MDRRTIDLKAGHALRELTQQHAEFFDVREFSA